MKLSFDDHLCNKKGASSLEGELERADLEGQLDPRTMEGWTKSRS